MKRVFVTSNRIPNWAIEELSKHFEVKVFKGQRITSDDLRDAVREFDGIIALLRDKFNRDVLSHAKRVRIIANYAVGYDNIDLEAATARRILVTNTPDVLSNATAELTIALMFTVARKIIVADKFTREGRFHGWEPDLFLGTELSGKTIGILGTGRIGTLTGLKAYALGMRVLYFSRRRNFILETQTDAKRCDLRTVLSKSDFITIHLPLSRETHHLIGSTEFNLMKSTAVVINTGRGAVIDESALVKALKSEKIAGAGLDVYEFEPRISEELFHLPNVVLLPHIGSATHRARNEMAKIVVENVVRYLQEQDPITPVNTEVIIKQ